MDAVPAVDMESAGDCCVAMASNKNAHKASLGDEPKKWGSREFWGVGGELDPSWALTEPQKQLQSQLMELCRTQIRPHAVHCDKTYTFPRRSLDALAELGLLGLIVPRELGGRGENHAGASMVVETLARYGCPSTALVYTMHLSACALLLKRHHGNSTIENLLKRLDKDKMVGTLVYSDPASGSHFWFSLSCKSRLQDGDKVRLLKYGSWATSAGFADWYAIQTSSPTRPADDYSTFTCYLVFKDEVRASSNEWRSLGMHGNQSGPVIIDGVFPLDRQIGVDGEGQTYNGVVAAWANLLSADVWNGIAMACMDVAKKHVTRKTHGDVGLRVCDYPTIQDYFGDCVCETNASRMMSMSFAAALDAATHDADWSRHADPKFMPYEPLFLWGAQVKFVAAKNVSMVSDKMLHACGGAGFKEDLGLERLLRDSKAGWVMALSNEVVRQMVGKVALLGPDCLDLWEEKVDRRVVHKELKKMTTEEKEALVKELMLDVQRSKSGGGKLTPYQDTDFENPFNTQPPEYVSGKLQLDGLECGPGLCPEQYTTMLLAKKVSVTDHMVAFTFRFASEAQYLACLPGQYVQMRIQPAGHPPQERYLSPISRPDIAGTMEVVVKYETGGILSEHLQAMVAGDTAQVRGPCGGFEYRPNSVEHLLLLASGAGVTPCLQMVRSILADPADLTQVTLLYHAETREELLLESELRCYALSDARLKLVLSLGEPPDHWADEEGFIDADMIQRHVPAPSGLRRKVVLCGGPTMAVSTLSALRELGHDSGDVYVYGQFGVEMVRMVYGRHTPLASHTTMAPQ